MSISTSQYVDLLVKKLDGVAKTDTAANKSPSNESIASPALNRGDTLWSESNIIPATAATTAGIVEAYTGTDAVETTADTTTVPIGGIYPTWLTGLTNWIPPEFGSTYFVQAWVNSTGVSDPTVGGTQIFDSGTGGTGEWYFDYQAGLLNFIGQTIPTALTGSKVIYIIGYRYVGKVGVQNLGNISIGNITALSSLESTGNITTTANISGSYILGNGSQLTGLPAGYSNADVSTYLASGTDSANIITTANISGSYLLGNGAYISGLPAGYSNADVSTYLSSGTETANIITTANVSGAYILGNGASMTGVVHSNDKPNNLIYVGKNGNDSTGTGSINAPLLTVQAAINAANALPSAATIILAPGNYVQDLVITDVPNGLNITGSGLSEAAITGNILISGSSNNIEFDNFRVSTGRVTHSATGYWSVLNMRFSANTGITKTSASTIKIFNTDLGAAGTGSVLLQAGKTNIYNSQVFNPQVSGATTEVNFLQCDTVILPTVTAGNVNFISSIMVSSGTGNSLNATGGNITLTSSLSITPTRTLAPVNFGASSRYRYGDSAFDYANTTFAGTAIPQDAQFQAINVRGGNVVTTGNISGSYLLGNGAFITGLPAAPTVVTAAASYYVATNGNDTTGTGSVVNPFLTISKAVSVAGNTAQIIVNPGDYTENVTIANVTSLSLTSTGSGTTDIYGSLTISGSTNGLDIQGIGLHGNLTHSATGTAYLREVNVGTTSIPATVVKSGSGYLEFIGSDLQTGNGFTTITVTSASSVVFTNTKFWNLTVANSGATVSAFGSPGAVNTTLTAGSLNLFQSLVFPFVTGGNAITATGGVLNMKNSGIVNPDLSPGKINLSAGTVFAYDDVNFDRANSSIGFSANVIADFQSIRILSNANTATVTASGNVTAGNLVTGGRVVSTGNIVSSANVVGTALTTGNITVRANVISSTDDTIFIDPAGGTGALSGNVVIQGNLTVNGTTTTVDSNTVSINDLVFNTANNASIASLANGGGLGVGPAGAEYATLLYNSTANIWQSNLPLNAPELGNATTYLYGDGSNISGLPAGYSNVDVNTYLNSGSFTGDFIPNGNATQSLGNVNNQWLDLWVSNATIYLNAVPLSVAGNGVLQFNGNDIVTSGSNVVNTGNVGTTGNISGSYILGNGSQLTGITASTGDITFVNTTMSAPEGDRLNINSLDGDGIVGSQLVLDADSTLTRLQGWGSQDSNSWTDADWATGVYTTEGGGTIGAIQFTGAATIVDFVSNLQGADHVYVQVNGGPLLVSDGWGGGGSNITFYVAELPATDPTTVTSFAYYYQLSSSISIDYDDEEFTIETNGLNLLLGTNTAGTDIEMNSARAFLAAANGSFEFSNYNTLAPIEIKTNATSVDVKNWVFDVDGNITLPTNTSSINYANGAPYGGSGGASTGNIYFNQSAILSDQSNAFVNLNDDVDGKLSLGTTSNANVQIAVNDIANTSSAIWVYDGSGNLTLPTNTSSINYANGQPYGGSGGGTFTNGLDAQYANTITTTGTPTGFTNYDLGNGSVAFGTNSVAPVFVVSGAGNGVQQWGFEANGNLTLPAGTPSINYANGAPYGGSASTGDVTFDNTTVQGDNSSLNLSAGPDYTATLAYLQVRAGDVPSHIHLDTGDNATYDLLIGNDSKYVQVGAGGNVSIASDGGAQYIWNYDIDGSLKLATVNSESAQFVGTRKIIGGLSVTSPYSTALTGGTPTLAYTSTSGTSSAKITFAVQSGGSGFQWEQFDVVATPSQDVGGAVNYVVSNRVKGSSTIPDTVVTATMNGNLMEISLTLDAAQTSGGTSSFDAVEFGLMVD